MQVKNFNLIMMLTAGIIVGIISVLMKYSLERLMYTLLVVLFVFFIIGTVIQGLINRILDQADQEQMDYERALMEEEEKELEMEEAAMETREEDNLDTTE